MKIHKFLHEGKDQLDLITFRREICVPHLKLGDANGRLGRKSCAPSPSTTMVDARYDGKAHVIAKREKERRCQRKALQHCTSIFVLYWILLLIYTWQNCYYNRYIFTFSFHYNSKLRVVKKNNRVFFMLHIYEKEYYIVIVFFPYFPSWYDIVPVSSFEDSWFQAY